MALDTSSWSGLRLVEQMKDGNRNEVWRGELNGSPVAVRQSARTPASLSWELDLLAFLDEHAFVVPTVVPTDTGERSDNGIVVQTWLTGEQPASDADWAAVAAELRRLHAITTGYPQRPGCCTIHQLPEQRRSVDADLDALPASVRDEIVSVLAEFVTAPTSLIHGDPHGPNLRVISDGSIGLLDWDESRVDVVWHDLSNLGVQVLDDADHARAMRLSHAWEAVNAWVAEPAYARTRLRQLSDP